MTGNLSFKIKSKRISAVLLSIALMLGYTAVPALAAEKIAIDPNNVTGGEGYKGSSYLNAADGNLDTFFDGLKGQYVQIDMGGTYDISSIKYRAGEGWATERMVGCYFEGSVNGIVWERIYTVTEKPEWGNGEMIELKKEVFETDNAIFRYIRLQAPPEQFCNVAEIELYGEHAEPVTEPVIEDQSFFDTFETAENWTDILGNWSVNKGYDGNSVYSQSMTDTGNSSTRNEMRAVIDNRTWSDAVYEFDVRYDGAALNNDMSNWFGVSFRKKDSYTSWRDESGYMLYWRIDGRMELGKGNASDMTVKSAAETGGALSASAEETGDWRHVKIVTGGNNIKVFLDNSSTPLYDWTDNSNHADKGYFTLNASASAWSFDNIKIITDGNLSDNSGYFDLKTGTGSGAGGAIAIPVVLFEKSVDKVELLNKEGTVIGVLSAESDYTITKNQDSTETYTFNNDVFSKLTNDTNYKIRFTFNDGSVSSYKLYVGSELERADKTALVNAIADASRHIEIDYTPESWTVLQNALNSALEIRDAYFSKQADVDRITDMLNDAINALVKKEDFVYTGGLLGKIAEAETLNENDYTALSWSRFSEALNTAKQTVDSDTSAQADIDAALRGLMIAIQNLSYKKTAPDGAYTEIGDLKTNDTQNPFGIDDPEPSFSWNMSSNVVGQKQTAYRIVAAKDSDFSDIVWDSDKVAGDISTGIKYAGDSLESSATYYWRVEVWDKDGGKSVSDTAKFTTALMNEDEWDSSSFITAGGAVPEKGNGTPIFRKEFAADKDIVSAVLYSTALGNYDVFINGERVGELLNDGTTVYDELKPGYTDMGLRVQYQSYDVTHLLDSNGQNTLSAIVTNGWWNNVVNGSVWGGSDQNRALRAQLRITYDDGTTEIIPTDTSWKCTYGGPVMYGDIFHGEYYNANYDTAWMENGYDDSSWASAKAYDYDVKLAAQRGQRLRIREELELPALSATVYEGAVGADNNQYGVINTKAIYSGSEDVELKKGQTAVFDFGQNFAGCVEIAAEGAKGTQITLKYGEMLNDEHGLKSRGNDGPEGSVYLANLRGAEATDIYTMSGSGVETYQPHYTYHGLRYMTVTASDDIVIHSASGQVLTSMEEASGRIYTSDSSVNQLYSNSLWGQYSNYLSIPSDCPQRDERQGWGADTWVFSVTGAYNADTYGFMAKWMQDMQDAQQRQNGDSEGDYGVTAPYWFSARWRSVGWADAGVIVPYNMYKMYGDKKIIEENYESMQKYVDVYLYKSHPAGRGNERDYGDWLYDELNTVELKEYLGTVFLAWDYLMMADMADTLGKTYDVEKYRAWYDEVKTYFNETYVDENGYVIIPKQDASLGTQPTAYLYALKTGLLPDDASVQKNLDALVSRIENNDNKLETGFLGTAVLLQTLTDFGRGDVAYKLLLQRGYPSWMFTLDQGATTFWERWNSYSKENGFGDVSMNSFNHYSFGVVAEWMYSYMAGIMYDMSRPGFKHIILQPLADASNNITFVDGSYDSAYGLIESGWEMTDGNLSYSAVIPANTSATLYLPADGQSADIDGAAAAGVKYIGVEEHNGVKTAKFELVSGGYDFAVSDDKITVTLKDEYVSSDIVYGLYANGEETEYIPASGDAVFKARLSINTEKPVSLIYAVYDKTTNELITVKINELENPQNIDTEIPVALPEERSDIILRIFLWDTETMKPILKSLKYTSAE